MKINHRIPIDRIGRSDPVPPEYQAVVDRDTARSAKRYADAQIRLAQAQERQLRIEREAFNTRERTTHERRLQLACALVELRREQLAELAMMMTSSPASAQHRGSKGYRPIPASPLPL